MHFRVLSRRPASNRAGFTVIESLVVFGLLFVLMMLIASLYRYHISDGAAKAKQDLIPRVPESATTLRPQASNEESPEPDAKADSTVPEPVPTEAP